MIKEAKSPQETGIRFTVTELCREFGVTARALRFYETKGLLKPVREGTRRRYLQRDRARLALILRGKRFGFNLMEIGELLDLYYADDSQVTQLSRTLETARRRLDEMKRQRDELKIAVGELEDQIGVVENMLTERRARSQGEHAVAAAAKR